MKRFVVILLAACLILGCGIGYFAAKNEKQDAGAPVALADPEPGADAAPAEIAAPRRIDFAAIRALYPMDEVVGDVDGRPVTWEEYFYWIADMGARAQSYIDTMALYGQAFDWEDKVDPESEDSFAQYTLQMAQDCVRQMNSVEAIAEENGVTLSAEDEAALAEKHRQNIAAACGEGASEEDFNRYLEENYVSRGMYDRLNTLGYLFNNIPDKLYGVNGADVSEEEALAYLREQDYLSASHILFKTVDLTTYEPLDEAAAAEKLEQAKAVSEELRAIEDVDERVRRFAELKEQYCEDTGKVQYPDGYLFTPGTTASEFEHGVKALEEYEVSEPVLSSFGYHVIMRLPLSVELPMDYSEDGEPLTARALYADAKYGELMNARIDGSVLTLRGDVEAFDLTKYLVDAE